ncbi:MAG: hypothetical protein IJ365_03605, partial [Clostridia bacterium]|nr:hypothetical protein [Clostridia bacterium]
MRKIISLILSLSMLLTMLPHTAVYAAEDIAIVGTNNGSANEIGTIDTFNVSQISPYQMSLLNSITSLSDKLGGKESSDSYISADFSDIDGALFAAPSYGTNASKRYRIFSFNVYGAALQKIKVRFASNLKPVCADELSTNSNIRSAQWNNIVFVCDTVDKSTKTYVNGVLAASANVIDVIKTKGFTIADDGTIYTSAGAEVKNISYCFNDVRFDVVKAGTYGFDDLTIAASDTEPVIEAPAVLAESDGYTIADGVINLAGDSVTLPALDGATYVVNGVAGATTVCPGDVVAVKKTTALGNLFTSYTAMDASNPLNEVVSLKHGLDGIENYFSELETTTFGGETCALLKGVTQEDGGKQMFLQYVNTELASADFVMSAVVYANDDISRIYFATSGHAVMGSFAEEQFVMDAWNTITVAADGETGVNTAYINGVEVSQTTQPVVDGKLRLVIETANDVLGGTDVYIDNFYVLKGSMTIPAATTTLDTVGSRVITNVYGMTYQQISDAITLSGTSVRTEFVYGDTTPAMTDNVKSGTKVNIYDRGVFVGDYIISFEQPVESILSSHDGLASTAVQKLYSEYTVETEGSNAYASFVGTESTNSDHLFIQYTSSACEGDMLLSINVKPADTTGSVYFATRYNGALSSKVQLNKLNTNEWNNLTLIMDSTTAKNALYVNGKYYDSCSGSIVDSVVRFIVSDTSVVGKKIYMDDFCIIKGKTVFPPLSGDFDIDGLTINGYYGMTYSEIRNALVVAKDGMTVSEFTMDGESVNALSEAEQGASISLYDNGVYIAQYTLGTAKYSIGECNGYSDGQLSPRFGSGEFSVKQEIGVYTDTAVEFLSALAQYDSLNNLVAVNIRKNAVHGNQTIETPIDITTTEGTYLSYMLWECGSLRPVGKAVTFEPYSSTLAESVVKLYPGYTTKAATFSFDDGI